MLFPLDDLASCVADSDMQEAHAAEVAQVSAGRGVQAWCARCGIAGPAMHWYWAASSGAPGSREAGVVGVCPECERPAFFHLVRRF